MNKRLNKASIWPYKNRILSGMDQDVEVAREKMNFVMKKLSVLLKTSDTGLLCTVTGQLC